MPSTAGAPIQPRWGRRLLGAFVILLSLALLAVVLKAGRAFYFNAQDYGGHAPPQALLAHPDAVGIPDLRNVDLTSRDGTRLRGWYVPPRHGAAVIVTPGTNANRQTLLREVRALADAGFGVLAFDWPGTGESAGRIDWGDGAVAALEGAVDWLARQPGVDAAQLGAFGFSMGSLQTLRVAAADPRLHAVVLAGTPPQADASAHWLHWARDPLHSLPEEWAARYYGWPWGVVRPMALVAHITPRAVFLIGGTKDAYAGPLSLTQLCDAAGSPKECWIVPGATHGAYGEAAPQEYARRLREFFTRSLGASEK